MEISAIDPDVIKKKLESATVGIAGLGGLGSNIAAALARAGVGRLILCDFDVVERSNLNRQNYYERQVGLKKCEATIELLKQINSRAEYIAEDLYLDRSNYQDALGGCDIVVEAFDDPACKADLVNWVLVHTDKIVVAASGVAGYGIANNIRTRKIRDRFYIAGDLVSGLSDSRKVMASGVGIAAFHQADCVVTLIIEREELGCL